MFITEGPLDSTSPLFVGREAELRQAERWLNNPGTVGSVAGARQTGKTSFLLMLRHRFADRFHFAFVDLEGIYGANLKTCFAFIANEMCEQLAGSLVSDGLAIPENSQDFLGFLRNVSERSQTVRTVVMLDEIGALPLDTSIRLAHTIRAAITNRHVRPEYNRFVFIISGSTDMLKLATGKLSPLKNVTESIYMPDLAAAEAFSLLRVGFDSLNLEFPPSVLERVLYWTGGHPYLTQLFGKTIARQASATIHPEYIDVLVEHFLAEEDKNLPHLRRALDDGPKQLWQVVQQVMAGRSIRFTRSDSIHAELELSGAIVTRDGLCTPRNQLYGRAFAAWATPTLPTRVMAERVRSTSTPPMSIIKILFLAANPTDTARLSLAEEVRAIDRAMRLASYRDKFYLEQAHAVRVADLQGLLMRHQPHIVHFSGHGAESGEIIFLDDNGRAYAVPPRALTNVFWLLKDNIRCVVLNACFSMPQAKAIAQHIDCVIGMTETIGDKEASTFAAAFYGALGYGRNVQTAFELGRNLIDLAGLLDKDVPQLLAHTSDPANITFAG